ncbi:MAG: RNA polymerase sigma factor [Candidatus Xenobia bacterium]
MELTRSALYLVPDSPRMVPGNPSSEGQPIDTGFEGPQGPGIETVVPASQMAHEEFERVWRQYGSFVYNVAFRLTGRKAEAEDIVQETFVRVYRFFHQFRGTSLKAWLFRIVTNEFFTRTQRRKKEQHVPLEWEDDKGNRLETILTDSTLDPSTLIEQHDLEEDVQLALNAVPEHFRVALILRDIQCLSYEEVARALNVPVGTVRSRLSRARQMFKNRLHQIKTKKNSPKRQGKREI